MKVKLQTSGGMAPKEFGKRELLVRQVLLKQ